MAPQHAPCKWLNLASFCSKVLVIIILSLFHMKKNQNYNIYVIKKEVLSSQYMMHRVQC